MKKLIVIIPVITLLLSGCGQTGPLYLPSHPHAQQKVTWPSTS